MRTTLLTSVLGLCGGLLVACSSDSTTQANSGGGAGVIGMAGGATAGANSAGGAASGGSTASAGATQAGAAGSVGGASSGGASSGGASGAGMGGAPAGGGVGLGGATGTGGTQGELFALKSSAFAEGAQIPLAYKCANVTPKGQNMSPPLSWGPGPAGTKSYAIVLMHLPSPEHWVLWDIPSSVTSLPENIEHAAQPAVPAGSKQSLANLDGFMGSGYLGPCPQAANSVQSYRFTLYALDVASVPGLTATSTPTQAATAVKAHLVAGSQGVSLTGTQIQTP